MKLKPATDWNFSRFLALDDDAQTQTIRRWLRETDQVAGVIYTDAFLEAQTRSNGELFEIDELSVEQIESDGALRRVKVQFRFNASAFEERVEQGGKLPIHGRATLVIYEDGSNQLQNVTADVVAADPQEN